MQMLGARFRLGLHRARWVASVLGSIVGGKHLSLRNGVDVRVDVEGAVAAVVHDARAVDLPVVVLWATAIHAVFDAAGNPGLTLILPGLVDHSWRKGDQLAEVTAVQHELRNLLAGDGEGDFRRLRLHGTHVAAAYINLGGYGSDRKLRVHPLLTRDADYDPVGCKPLEPLG